LKVFTIIWNFAQDVIKYGNPDFTNDSDDDHSDSDDDIEKHLLGTTTAADDDVLHDGGKDSIDSSSNHDHDVENMISSTSKSQYSLTIPSIEERETKARNLAVELLKSEGSQLLKVSTTKTYNRFKTFKFLIITDILFY
jgi:hypothetical protein